jgi:hypothetical protein
LVKSAAPTLNLEYGETEPSRALAAAATSFFKLIFTFEHKGNENEPTQTNG